MSDKRRLSVTMERYLIMRLDKAIKNGDAPKWAKTRSDVIAWLVGTWLLREASKSSPQIAERSHRKKGT